MFVDPERIGLLQAFSWAAHDYRRSVYAVRSFKLYLDGGAQHRSVSLHQTLLPTPKGIVIDHKDGNGLNNCRSNLRAVSVAVNSQAQRNRRGKKSVYRGVCPAMAPGKWRATIMKSGKQIWLGTFPTQAEAARAYDIAAFALFGPMAEFNFPQNRRGG